MDTCTTCVINLCFINGLGFVKKPVKTQFLAWMVSMLQWISCNNLSFLYTSIYLFWGVKNHFENDYDENSEKST